MSLTTLPEPYSKPKRKKPRAVPVLAFLLGGFCLLLSGVPFLFLLFWILAIPAIFMGFVAFQQKYPMGFLGVVGMLFAALSLIAGLGSTIGSFTNDTGQTPTYNTAGGAEPVPSSTEIIGTDKGAPAPSAPLPKTAEAPSTDSNDGGTYVQPQQDDSATVYYANCSAVRAAGKNPLHAGDPGYASWLDRDGDGIACEG